MEVASGSPIIKTYTKFRLWLILLLLQNYYAEIPDSIVLTH